jgi:oligopeptide/dipeptide ABC transporter ATP-binding protein
MTAPLIEVRNLTKHYPVGRLLGDGHRVVHAVDDISFTIEQGTTLAVVGESGSGKTTTAQLLLLLEKPTSGSIHFRGVDVTHAGRRALREYKQSVQAVFQDPYSSINPRMRVGEIVGEPLQIHGHLSRRELAMRVGELLEQVGLSPAMAGYYPHQFSGGQRQRIAIARALSLNPKLIVLDEPVSALDVSIQAQILNLLVDLQKELGLSYLLIAHDLAIVEHMSQRVAVMYAGKFVEMADGERLYAEPAHPYTSALMVAVPSIDPDTPLHDIVGGEVSNPANPPSGCRFHPRCPLRRELGSPQVCVDVEPPLIELAPGHTCACHFRQPADALPSREPQAAKAGPPPAGASSSPVSAA